MSILSLVLGLALLLVTDPMLAEVLRALIFVRAGLSLVFGLIILFGQGAVSLSLGMLAYSGALAVLMLSSLPQRHAWLAAGVGLAGIVLSTL